MRLILTAALAFVPAAFAQHSPTGSYGNVLHPGVPSPGALRPPALRPSGGGINGGGRIINGPIGGRRTYGGGAVYIPYPIYGGYGMGYGYDGFYANDNNPGPGNAYSAEQAPAPPTVIINQNFQTDSVHPQFRDDLVTEMDDQMPYPLDAGLKDPGTLGRPVRVVVDELVKLVALVHEAIET